MSHQGFRTITSNIWEENNSDLESTILTFQKELVSWNKMTFGNVFQQIRRTNARLLGVQKQLENSRDSQLLKMESDLQKHLTHLIENEENIWKMKSRVN